MQRISNYMYRTSCLTCGWHKNAGVAMTDIHKHLDDCYKGVVVISIREIGRHKKR